MTRPAHLGIAAFAAVLLISCATPGDPGGEPTAGAAGAVDPAGVTVPGAPAAPGEVVGQGTVLQVGDTTPRFCLGGVMESYPPQCSGPPIVSWDWATAEQAQTASGVTWGAYAVTGTWDGTVFTRTGAAIPLALYDAMPFEDPLAGRQGATNPSELDRIQQEVYAGHEGRVVTAGTRNGFVTITVVYDDGTFQSRMDAEYGSDVVVVESALRPVR